MKTIRALFALRAKRSIALQFIAFALLAAAALVGRPVGKDFTDWVRATPISHVGMFNQPPTIFFSNFTWASTPIFVLYLLATCVIGYGIIALFREPGHAEFKPRLFLTGFIPGYAAVILLNRIVTIILPHRPAAKVCLVALLALALFCLLLRWRQQEHGGTLRSLWNAEWGWTVLTLAGMSVLALTVGSMFVTGDGTRFFLSYFQEALAARDFSQKHFPIFAQHYDEAIYLYPIVFFSSKTRPEGIIGFYWLFYVFFKSGIVFALYGAFRAFAIKPAFALLFTAFVFAGRNTLTHTHLLLFDSCNPLLVSLHPARTLMAALPVLVLAAFSGMNSREKIGRPALLVVGALGAGFSALPINFIVTAIAAAFLAIIIHFIEVEVGLEKYLQQLSRAAFYLPFTLLGLLFMAYLSPSDGSAIYLALLVLCMLCLFCFPLVSRAGRWRSYLKAHGLVARVVLVFLLGFVIGTAVLGNLGVTLFRFFESWSIPLLTSGKASGFAFGAHSLVHGPWGFVFHHLTGLAGFFQSFGIPLLLCAITFVVLGAGWLKTESEASNRSVVALGILTLFLLTNLIFYDFFSREQDWLDVWVKSRLLEPWFYSSIAAGLLVVYFQALARGWLRYLGFWLFFLGLACVILDPKISPIRQFYFNCMYLLHR